MEIGVLFTCFVSFIFRPLVFIALPNLSQPKLQFLGEMENVLSGRKLPTEIPESFNINFTSLSDLSSVM